MNIPKSNVLAVMHEQYMADKRDCNNNLAMYRAFRDNLTHAQWEEILQFLFDCEPIMDPDTTQPQFRLKLNNWLNWLWESKQDHLTYPDVVNNVMHNEKYELKNFYKYSWGLVVLGIEMYDELDLRPNLMLRHIAKATAVRQAAQSYSASPIRDVNNIMQSLRKQEDDAKNTIRKYLKTPPSDHPGLD